MDAVVELPTEIVDRLYAVPPRRFVAERDAAAADARAAGDRDTAAALVALRRPTVAAWLVNLLALRRPDLMAELADLAAELQAAQRDLQGGHLRELAGRRRTMVGSLVAAARSLAERSDPELAGGKVPLAEVEATLQAALGDRQVAEQVRSGRLVRPARAGGFGEVETGGAGAHLRLVPGGPGDPEQGGSADRSTDRAALAAAEQELADARAAAAAAEAELERVTAAKREAVRELADIDAALAELQAGRATAAARLAQAEAADFDARRQVRRALQRVARAESRTARED